MFTKDILKLVCKYCVVFTLFSCVYLLRPNMTYAATVEVYPTSINFSNNFNNPNNVFTLDSQYTTKTLSSGNLWMVYPTFSIPTGSTVTKITAKFYGNSSGNSGTFYMSPYTGSTSCNNSGNPNFPMANGTQTRDFTSGNCTNWNTVSSISALNSGSYQFRLINDTGLVNQDAISLIITYDPPVASITVTDSYASPSAGLLYMSLQGDVLVKGSNIQCRIDLLEHCTAPERAAWTSQTSVARIYVDSANPRTSTQKRQGGNNDYDGYFYSPTSSVWKADDISVPYHAGFTCDYPGSYVCTTRTCTYNEATQSTVCGDTTVVGSGNVSTIPGLVASPSAGINAPGDIEPDCTNDILCSFRSWLSNTLIAIFVPSQSFNTLYVSQIKDDVYKRAPFGYIITVLGINLTNPVTTTTVPTLAIPVNAGTINTTVNWTAPTFISTTIATLKDVLNVVCWLAFVIYLFFIPRRLTHL